jgi:intraflagellar transport protein 172
MSSTQVVVHSAVPYALGWGKCIATAGNDNKVSESGTSIAY